MNGPKMTDHGQPGKQLSYWIDSTATTDYPVMPDGLQVDVAIVGGGIAGITAAVLLKQQGLKVAIIEADRVANLASGHTTAHISAASTPSYYRDIARKFGKDRAQECARSVLDSIEKIEELVRAHGLDCDFFRTTEYVYGHNEGARDELNKEAEFERDIGLPVSMEDSAPLPFETHGAIKYSNQAEFHPRKYLLGLASTLPGDGCHVFEGTRVLSTDDGAPCAVHTDRGVMRADKVVIATGSPILNLGLLPLRMTVHRSYVLGVQVGGSIPDHSLFYSSEQPCHYIRGMPSSPGLLLVGGEDHTTGEVTDTKKSYADLERYCRGHFDVQSIEYSWSTQDQYSFDKLPFIGPVPGAEHHYVATGFKGTGMTYGTLSGIIISDLIAKGNSPYASVYSPGRFDLMASGQKLLTRNVHVAEMFARARLETPEPVSSLQSGEARLVEIEDRRAAAYRDDSGNLHAVSPVCRHLGCYVNWNSAERTWDCPCHGSRYDPDGRVINAPTSEGLPPVETGEQERTRTERQVIQKKA